jgi:hypothetical protein
VENVALLIAVLLKSVILESNLNAKDLDANPVSAKDCGTNPTSGISLAEAVASGWRPFSRVLMWHF